MMRTGSKILSMVLLLALPRPLEALWLGGRSGRDERGGRAELVGTGEGSDGDQSSSIQGALTSLRSWFDGRLM